MTIKTSLTVLALSLGLSTPALADDAHHPEKAAEKAAAPAAAAPAKPAKLAKPAKSAKKATAEDDCPMHKGGMGMMGHGGEGHDPEAMMSRMQQLEKRMDMMEQMMKGGAPKP